ncbi:MAG TPA: hypothetical protein VE090_04485 [Methylomirabilota bacterium]|nr:hypothetical protein [Methylomirabilota bacterium]
MPRELPYHSVSDLEKQRYLANQVKTFCEVNPETFNPALHLPAAEKIAELLDPLLKSSIPVFDIPQYRIGEQLVSKHAYLFKKSSALIFEDDSDNPVRSKIVLDYNRDNLKPVAIKKVDSFLNPYINYRRNEPNMRSPKTIRTITPIWPRES